jgi:hypothetical protein
VTEYLAAQTPTVRAAVERLRAIVADAAPNAVEIIKWNSPSYTVDGEDRLTVNVDRKGLVRLILHRGTTELETKGAASTFTGDPGGLLTWHSDIRASLLADANPDAAADVVRAWVSG